MTLTSEELNHWTDDIGEVAAFVTTHRTGQLVATRTKRVQRHLAHNRNLCHDAWWTLARAPKLTSDHAELLYRQPLNAEQLTHAAADQRMKPTIALLRNQPQLDDSTVEAVVARALTFPQLRVEIASSTGVPLETAASQLPHLLGYRRTTAIAALAARLDNDTVVDMILDPATSVNDWRWGALAEALGSRPGLSASLLETLLAGKGRGTRENLILLVSIVENRWAAPDTWRAVAGILGAKPTWSADKGVLLGSIAGNPNTEMRGVNWALANLERHENRIGGLRYGTDDNVRAVITARRQGLTPVTSDWENPATADEAHTIAVLGAVGQTSAVKYQALGLRWGTHPNTTQTKYTERKPLPAGFDFGDTAACRPALQNIGVRGASWQAREDWAHAVDERAGAWIDTQMADADEHTWANLYTLAENWSGTARDLVATAHAL
jgi:hypothetical protein